VNFADFQRFRETLLRERAGVLDCAATNLYAALARLIPPLDHASEVMVHRCHIAAEWAERFGFPPGTARRALVSCGVRDSLALLFRHYAGKDARLWLPADNYPVYGELARTAGLPVREFATLPKPAWPEAGPIAASELLVVTNPLKPLGRWLTGNDVAALTAWLAAHSGRRLLLDAVYTFETHFHATTLHLLATGQTILLHSLTKGWLHPRLFGFALVPESDAADLALVFRAQPPPQSNLARARELMASHAGMPATIARELGVARNRLLSAISQHPAGLTRMEPSLLIRFVDKIGGHSEAASGGSKNPVASQIRDSSTALHSAQNDPEKTGETSYAPLALELPGNRICTEPIGYFLPVAGRWRDILDDAKVLGLPASVFGSQCKDITILSSLSFLA